MQRNFNSEPNWKIFKREIRLKDSFVKPGFINNIKEDAFIDFEEPIESSRRSKSIHKRPLLSRRNIQHIMTSRQKNTHSANTYILSQNFQLRNTSTESYKKPEERFSDSKLINFKMSNSIERRNKQYIRPFWLYPNTSVSIYEKANHTRNENKTNDFISLPDIFSKDTIQPSTKESDRYVKDE